MLARVEKEMKGASSVKGTPLHTFGSNHRMKSGALALVNRHRREGVNYQY
jgi:hypothetical protein